MNKDAVAEMSQPYQVEAAKKIVPEGYKQTEVGVTNSSGANLNATCGGPKGKGMDSRRIPEGWRCLPFEDALTIRHGRDQKPVESINGKYPIFGTGGQMGWAMEYLYDKPSVLIGRKGSINKPRYMETPFWTVDTLFYSEIKSGFNAKFIFYKFCMINWEQYNEASGVPSLNSKTIEKVTALFPTFKEQCIIANALSDTDALLSELEKLIAKKQAIKTATMQQLLTGRTRLPQFANHPDGSKKGYKQSELGEIPEDWEIVPLGKLANIKTGSKNNQDKVADGIYPFFVRSETVERLNSYSYECEAILVPGEGGIGSIFHYINGKFDAHQRVYVIREFVNCSGKYVYFQMRQHFGAHAMENSVKATVDSLRLPTFQEFSVFVPPLEEQTAIATILADMDEEIQALEQRLNKTRQIKQGMMQELLTGKTRLIKGGKNV